MRRMGWRPDTPDRRDHEYSPKKLTRQTKTIDLRDRFFKPWNQRSLGCCTGYVVGSYGLYLDIFDNDRRVVDPSVMFIYYNGRLIEGTTESDEGAEIRNVIKGVAKFGYPDQELCPYRIQEFAKKPSAMAYRKALKERIKSYERVSRRISHFRKILAEGLPVAVGISMYDSAFTERVDKTGIIPLPKKEKMEGGHAILIVGYEDDKKRFIFRNSWGTGWGAQGYGYLPYEYIEDDGLSDDFWVIRR